jgi:predicted transcriptional regulator
VNGTALKPELRDRLKKAMVKYEIPEYVMAMQLSVSLSAVKAFLKGTSTPSYLEKRVEEWFE